MFSQKRIGQKKLYLCNSILRYCRFKSVQIKILGVRVVSQSGRVFFSENQLTRKAVARVKHP